MQPIPNPRHVVLITSRGRAKVMGKEIEKDNVMALDWQTQVSFSPLLWTISVGKTRFTSQLISQARCFCINFMPYSMKDIVLKAGSMSGEHTDKFKELGLEKDECEKIECPKLRAATGIIECEVENIIEAGDHYIYIGKVLKSNVRDDKRLLHISNDKFTTTI